MQMGEKSIWKWVWIISPIFFILGIAVANFIFMNPTRSDLSDLATAANSLKQDIVAFKSPEANIAAHAWPAYQQGLIAELKGDQEFAQKNYAAARQAYLEAIYNFKKSAEPTTEPPPEKVAAARPQPPTLADPDRSNEETIKAQARKVYEKVLNEARQRTAREEKEKAVPAPAIPALAAAPKDTVDFAQREVERRHAEAVKTSMATAKMKVDKESFVEAPFQDAIKIEAKAEVAYAGNNFEQAEQLYKLAEGQYQKITNERANQLLREKERGETAQREIRRLLNSYKGAFENRDLQGLKTFFNGNFTAADEKAWSTFFRAAKTIKAKVADENIRLGDEAAEVNLAVLIDYANQKDIPQNPLAFKENWTLAERNGRWLVVSRQTR